MISPVPVPENSVTRQAQTRASPIVMGGLAIVAAIAGFTPTAAPAQDYDMDCKLILCMPAGFPSGCGDAFDHMLDRLRDGKSPIGFCALGDGTEYDGYDIDYAAIPASSRDGWRCPPGKPLHHGVRGDDAEGLRLTVTAFCYDTSHTRRSWTSEGYGDRTFHLNRTRPERMDFQVNLTVEPGTPVAWSRGWQRFNADIGGDRGIIIRYAD